MSTTLAILLMNISIILTLHYKQSYVLYLQVLAHIRGYGEAAQEPQQFPTSPALAVPIALARAQMQQSEVDYWEINQAFSVVDLVNQKLLGVDPSRSACMLSQPVITNVSLKQFLDHDCNYPPSVIVTCANIG